MRRFWGLWLTCWVGWGCSTSPVQLVFEDPLDELSGLPLSPLTELLVVTEQGRFVQGQVRVSGGPPFFLAVSDDRPRSWHAAIFDGDPQSLGLSPGPLREGAEVSINSLGGRFSSFTMEVQGAQRSDWREVARDPDLDRIFIDVEQRAPTQLLEIEHEWSPSDFGLRGTFSLTSSTAQDSYIRPSAVGDQAALVVHGSTSSGDYLVLLNLRTLDFQTLSLPAPASALLSVVDTSSSPGALAWLEGRVALFGAQGLVRSSTKLANELQPGALVGSPDNSIVDVVLADPNETRIVRLRLRDLSVIASTRLDGQVTAAVRAPEGALEVLLSSQLLLSLNSSLAQTTSRDIVGECDAMAGTGVFFGGLQRVDNRLFLLGRGTNSFVNITRPDSCIPLASDVAVGILPLPDRDFGLAVSFARGPGLSAIPIRLADMKLTGSASRSSAEVGRWMMDAAGGLWRAEPTKLARLRPVAK